LPLPPDRQKSIVNAGGGFGTRTYVMLYRCIRPSMQRSAVTTKMQRDDLEDADRLQARRICISPS